LAEAALSSLDDKTALKLLRDQTTYLVLLVRVDNQAKRDEWKEKVEKREEAK